MLNFYLLTNFSLCSKIEMLKNVPEGVETDEGLMRELQRLRYIHYYVYLTT